MDFWTADRIETLRMMKAEGARVKDIMHALGATRGAVIGKMDRLGLTVPSRPTAWTPERCERVKALHATGMRYADIAAELGDTTARGVEKIATKMGLPRRAYHHRSAGNNACRTGAILRTGTVTPRKPRAFKPRLVVTSEPSKDLAANILDVTGCRWAITPHTAGKADHMFCNHPTEAGASYCPYHMQMMRPQPVAKIANKRFIIPTSLLRMVG